MLRTVLTLDASATVADASALVAAHGDATDVVVRRRVGAGYEWFLFVVAELRGMLDGASPESRLGEVVDLSGRPTFPELSFEEAADGMQGVVVDDGRVAGVQYDSLASPPGELLGAPTPVGDDAAAHDGSPTRSIDFGDVGAEPADDSSPMRSIDFGDVASEPADDSSPMRSIDFGDVGAEPADDSSPMRSIDFGEEPAASQEFSAFPHLDAPDAVAPNESFALDVSLSKEQQAGTSGGAISVPTAAPTFELTVQVVAPDFAVTSQVRQTMTVDRTDLSTARVTFELAAGPDLLPGARVTVEFSYEGNLCGRAWREVHVIEAGEPAPPVRAESSDVATPEPETAPDLTVTINRGSDDKSLTWSFTSPHDVEIPAPVTEELPIDSAKSFALDKLLMAAKSLQTSLGDEQMAGIADSVSGAMPVEFWTTLDAVWRIATSQERTPTVLLVSADPYVPWELASTGDSYLDPELLDDEYPPILGAQVRLGRWTPPGKKPPRGPQRPSLPPSNENAFTGMALVIGDYLDSNNVRPLPEARAEGDALAAAYTSAQLTATEADINRLLGDEVDVDGRPADVIHFACHGQIDQRNPLRNGIVISDATPRLDELMIRGSKLGTRNTPFVFVNACQLGQVEAKNLADYGGMAGAFLHKGACAFVAPLWEVADKVAREFAIDFYQQTVTEGLPVAEALRRLRKRFSASGQAVSTYLAYTYYGHPELRLVSP